MPYIGNQPGTGVRSRFIYTATASQTTFTGADNNSKTLKYADSAYVDVFLNGVCLVPGTDYTASTKTSIVLTQAASLNDTLEVIAYDVATMDDSISATDGGTFNSDVTFADGADIITASAGTDNVRLGDGAGASIASGGNQNTLIGKDAGTALTTGDANVIVGHSAGDALTDADYNVAVGFGALSSDTKGDRSVAIGLNALQAQNHTSVTQTYNTAVGDNAGYASTTGINNTFIGALSGDAVTTGNLNTFVGSNAGSATDDGASNTAVGAYALDAGNCADHNTAIGAGALGGSSFTGYDNTCVGSDAGNAATTGYSNTFVGKTAGSTVTTGNANTILGRYDGNSGGLDMRTLSNQIVLSDGAGTPHGGYNGLVNSSYPHWNFNSATNSFFATSVRHSGSGPYGLAVNFTGASPNSTSREFIFCNDPTASRFTVFADGSCGNATGTYAQYSDIKLKENIADASSQWDDIKAVRVRNFSMKADNKDKANMIGVIAQELEDSGMGGLISESFDKDADGLPTEETTKTVKQSILYMKAVKALQEAMARIETLETKVAALEAG
jgi:hypothetical protein